MTKKNIYCGNFESKLLFFGGINKVGVLKLSMQYWNSSQKIDTKIRNISKIKRIPSKDDQKKKL